MVKLEDIQDRREEPCNKIGDLEMWSGWLFEFFSNYEGDS